MQEVGQLVAYVEDDKALDILRLYPDSIQHIDNPSLHMQEVAVSTDADAILWIKHPYETVQKMAVRKDGLSIAHIGNPPPDVQMMAVKSNPASIIYITKPTMDVLLYCKKHYETENENIHKAMLVSQKYIVNQMLTIVMEKIDELERKSD